MDLNAIRERWAGRTWRYVERRLGRDKSFLAECTLMVDGRTSGIWLDEPQPVEAEVLAAAAQAPEDVRALLTRIDELETALRHYTEAEVVSSWGMQETSDDGQVARQALGLPAWLPKSMDEARAIVASDDDHELQLHALSRLDNPPPAVATALHRWRFESDEVATILADLKTALETA